MAVSPIPSGYHTLTAQLSLNGAADAITFYKNAFGAEQVNRAPDPTGTKIWHASLRIGSSMIFVNNVFPEMGDPNPSKTSLWLYGPDVDAAFERAVAAGAKAVMPPADMFWGDRMCQVEDPFGQKWNLATRVKNMTPEEMKRAGDEMFAQMKEQKQ